MERNPLRPSWISDWYDFISFRFRNHPVATQQVSAQSDQKFGKKLIFKMAAVALAAILFNGAESFKTILDFWLIRFYLVSIQKSSCCYTASFGSKRPKVWEEIDFQDGGCGRHFGVSIGSILAILSLLGALMLLIKLQLNWIIEKMPKIWILNIYPI